MSDTPSDETWRIVDVAPDYEVSDLGRVRRIKPDSINRPLRVLAQSTGSSGRRQVSLCRDRAAKSYAVHALVAAAFIGPRPPGAYILHNDGNHLNNRASNLRYGSHAENTADAMAHGSLARGSANGNSKLTSAQVLAIRAATGAESRIAKEFGLSHSTVTRIRRRESWAHL